jgi:hypothetical protein
MATFLRINHRGISPAVNSIAGKRKKGSSAATSYLEKEITVKRKSRVVISLARGSSL